MKLMIVRSILFLISFLVAPNTLFAQTMWSIRSFGTNWDNSSTISASVTLLIIIGLFVTAVPTLAFWKSNISKKIITKSIALDTIWNVAALKSYTQQTFLKIQNAWENKDLKPLLDILTPDLYDKFSVRLKNLIEKDEKNYLRSIEFTIFEIIGCEDRKDNSKDRYIAYIEGRLLNYTTLESTGQIIKNSRKEKSDFSCTYHFVRIENEWKLEQINDSVNRLDILKTKTVIEE